VIWRRVRFGMRRSHVLLVIIVVVSSVLLAIEVFWSLMLMCAAIVLISADGLVDISRRELVELLVVTENDDGDVDRA
jgi:hypothetical protein